MKHIKHLLLLTIVFFSLLTFGQKQKDTIPLEQKTIKNQFEYILRVSSDFKGNNGNLYEAIKLETFNKLKKHTLDSLSTNQKQLVSLKKTIKGQSEKIQTLQTNLSNTQANLEEANSKRNSIVLFGLKISKVTYNLILWGIIAVLLILLIVFVYKFKDSNQVTKLAKENLSELQKEFDEHRKTALEREQKVRRQLIDEINKNKKGK